LSWIHGGVVDVIAGLRVAGVAEGGVARVGHLGLVGWVDILIRLVICAIVGLPTIPWWLAVQIIAFILRFIYTGLSQIVFYIS